MNCIFLDFDGVCTSTLETPGSYLNHTPDEYGPSPMCISRLLKLCHDANAKIIISSNWRKFEPDGKWTFDGNTVANPMNKLKDALGKYCIGTLPPIRHTSKSQVLLNWLNDHSNEISNFVIFDDDLHEGFQSIEAYGIASRFIHTKYDIGLTDADCKRAYDILKGNT